MTIVCTYCNQHHSVATAREKVSTSKWWEHSFQQKPQKLGQHARSLPPYFWCLYEQYLAEGKKLWKAEALQILMRLRFWQSWYSHEHPIFPPPVRNWVILIESRNQANHATGSKQEKQRTYRTTTNKKHEQKKSLKSVHNDGFAQL